jgi:N-acetylglucosamine kinase-like BadF-type ATPase
VGVTRSVPAVLAIDAGNSKTDAVLVSADGRVLGTARGGGFHPPVVGVRQAVAGLAPLVARAVARAGGGGTEGTDPSSAADPSGHVDPSREDLDPSPDGLDSSRGANSSRYGGRWAVGWASMGPGSASGGDPGAGGGDPGAGGPSADGGIRADGADGADADRDGLRAHGAEAADAADAADAAGNVRALGADGAGPPPYAEHLSACLANADLPAEEEALTRELAARGWGRTTAVANDTFALLRAGVADGGDRVGVAVVCGTGINCAGIGPDGRTARFPAIGRISGDWGGGGHLAKEALWWAARAADGRGQATALARALPAHFGLAGMYELIEALHLGHLPRARRLESVPVLFAVAEAGDAVARAVVARQAEEVVTMAAVALGRLGLLDQETPVVLGGGVLAARHPLLERRVRELLAERAPKAVPRVVTAPPVLGAALLGLDRLDAPAAAHARLRAEYRQYGEG